MSSEACFVTAGLEWVAAQGGRSLNRLERGEFEAVARSLKWKPVAGKVRENSALEGRLEFQTKTGGSLVLVAAAQFDDDESDGAEVASADALLNLRVTFNDDEVLSCDARAQKGEGKGGWASHQVRATCEQKGLQALHKAALPLVDDQSDVLNFLVALPWLPPASPLFNDVRAALTEDLLVDLCDDEGEDDVGFAEEAEAALTDEDEPAPKLRAQ